MALAEQANLVVQLSLKDNLSGAVKGIKGALGGLDKSTSNTQKALGKTAHNAKLAFIGVGSAIAGGALVAIREFSNFEAAMNTINTVAQLNQEQLDGVGDSLRRLSTESGTALDELTTGYYDLVSAGVAAADAQGVLEAANTLAIGGLATTGETIDLLTTAINAYGKEASEAGDIADYFAQAIAAGKVTAADLASSFAQVGPIAAASGIEIEELAAAYGVLTAQGVPAAEASTQMRAAIIALKKPTAELEALEKKLGVSFQDLAEEEGLAAAYQLMREEAEKAGIEMIDLTGRVEGTSFALAVSGENADKYNQALVDVRESTEGAGAAAEQAEQRQKGLDFQFRRLRAIGRDIALVFGERLAPAIGGVAEKLNDLLTNNRGKIEGMADSVGKLIDKIATPENLERGLSGAIGFLREMPWNTISEGLRITGQAAKLIIDTFRSLPPDIQKILIGALAVNKVTGGLLTGVARDLAGIALKSLTSIFAGNVTVVGKSVIAPGAGGIPPAGAAGAGGLAAFLGPIAVGLAGGFAIKSFESQAAKDMTGAMDQVNWAAVGQEQAQELGPFFEHFGNALSLFGLEFGQSTTALGVKLQTLTDKLPAPNEGEEERTQRQNNAALVPRDPNALTPGDLDAQLGPHFRTLDLSLLRVAGKLDTNNNGQVSMREALASKLGITVDQLRLLKEQSAGSDVVLASKLGISADHLRELKGQAMTQVNQLQALNRKDFSPTSHITISNQFNVSARPILNALNRYRTSGANVKI